jgi:hypothetical protein
MITYTVILIVLFQVTYLALSAEVVNWNSPNGFDSLPPTCQVDNWGMPHQTDIHPYFPDHETEIRIPCMQQWEKNRKPMSDLFPMATALWYKDSEVYDKLFAQDLIPENKDLYPLGSNWGKGFRTDYTTFKPKAFMASTCQTASKEEVKGGPKPMWEVTRIGPIRTYGGYDWVQLGWDNLWGLKEKLEDHPDGIYVLDQYMSPVFEVNVVWQLLPILLHTSYPFHWLYSLYFYCIERNEYRSSANSYSSHACWPGALC